MKRLVSLALVMLLAVVSGPAIAQVVSYQFEGDATDSAGGDNNGTLNGGANTGGPNLSVATPGTGSLVLDGVDDYLSIGDGLGIVAGGDQFTFSTYINLTAFPGGTGTTEVIYFSTPSAGNAARLILQIRGDGSGGANFALGGRTNEDPNDSFARYTSNPGLILNTTHHIAATVDVSGVTSDVHLYLDGLEVPWTLTSVGPNPPGTGFTTNAFDADPGFSATVGATGVPGNYLSGSLDDLRIYETVLSDVEIGRLAGVPEPASLVLCGLAGAFGLLRRKR